MTELTAVFGTLRGLSARRVLGGLRSDSLYRNSLFLMVSTGTMSLLGFGFWWLCARLFTPVEVGLGTALISGMSLISYFSTLGVDSAFVRFLPRSERRDEELDTGLLLVGVTSVVLGGGYVLALPWVAPQLDVVRTHPWFGLAFVVLASAATLNQLTDSVFIAFRSAQYNLLVSGLMSLTKLALPLAVAGLGAFGIFLSSGAAACLALALSVGLMMRRFGYRPRLRASRGVVKHVLGFASANYVANCLNILPTMVLPVLVVDRLGAAEAGYYYLAFMVANLLYTVAYSVTQSLFAEGSYSEEALPALVRRAAILLALLMVPAAAVLAVVPAWLLAPFGESYVAQASSTLTVLALAAPGLAVYSVSSVLLRVRGQVAGLIGKNVVYAGVILGLAFAWAGRGLVWVALAWLVGQFVAGAFGAALLRWGRPAGTGFARHALRR